MVTSNKEYPLYSLAPSESFQIQPDLTLITPVIWNGVTIPLYETVNGNSTMLSTFIKDVKEDLASLDSSVGNMVKASLPEGGVATDLVADSAITTNKIAPNAVTTERLADGAITPEKLVGIDVIRTALINGTTVKCIPFNTTVDISFTPEEYKKGDESN